MLQEAPLGKKTAYVDVYTPDLLYPVPRTLGREKTGLAGLKLPFEGTDIWTGFEISWLSPKGKPQIAMGEFRFPSSSPFIVESKSFKLYLNSLTHTVFSSVEEVEKAIHDDLSRVIQDEISIQLFDPKKLKSHFLSEFSGYCLDDLDIETSVYDPDASFLSSNGVFVEETLYSDLLKSNCLATGQPDWGSVLIRYAGPKIDREGLLKYIISYRNHSGFAEHCVEQIFSDIHALCKPKWLTVYGRYTRRGGLDINPFRSNFEQAPINLRQWRQ